MRLGSAFVCAASLVALHLSLHEGQAVRQWGVLENDIAILPRCVIAGVVMAVLSCLPPRFICWID